MQQMARIPRSKLSPGWFHCINRGVNRNTIFFDDHDYAVFRNDLIQTASKLGLSIGAFCLMPNHWHIVINCSAIETLSSLFKNLSTSHATRHHTKYKTTGYGSIYQGRYKSIPIEDEIILGTICDYVELNPVRANLVSNSDEWKWSSAWNGWKGWKAGWKGTVPFQPSIPHAD
jgi:putative transposase